MKKWLSYLTRVGLVTALVIVCLFIQGVAAQTGPMELVANRTQHSKLFSLGGSRYGLQTSLGSLHYLDGSGSWQDIDYDYIEADTGDFTARFTRLPYLVRMGDDCRRRIYPDRNDLSYWIEVARPFPSMGTPTKVGGYWVWNFPNAIIAVTIRPDAVKLGFRLKNALAPSSITFPFSSQGITRNGSELLHDGEVVAYLQKPDAVDANGVERDCTINFGAEQITISLNTTGLVYPIDIDPTFSVGASTDDCDVRWDTSIWIINALSSTTVTSGYANAVDFKKGAGFRFLGVTIPQGATIDVAYLTFVARFSDSGTTVNTRITGEDVDNAATWSTLANYQARRGTVVGGANDNYITSAQVDWDNIAAWTAGTSYNSPSIVSVIQEIINRAGWVSSNDLGLWWDDHDGRSTTGGSYIRRVATWDHATYNPPALYVEYSLGSVGFSFGYIMGG